MSEQIEETHVILDLETTGLKVLEGHYILEIGALHIDFKSLEVLGSFHAIDDEERIQASMDDYVIDMHRKNGLLHEIELFRQSSGRARLLDASAVYKQYALDVHLAEYFRGLGGGKIILCGNSVHFDRSFMEVHTPRALELCHYRMVDTSAMRQVYKKWCGEDAPKEDMPHRALGDCQASLRTLRWFRNIVVAGHAMKEAFSMSLPSLTIPGPLPEKSEI